MMDIDFRGAERPPEVRTDIIYTNTFHCHISDFTQFFLIFFKFFLSFLNIFSNFFDSFFSVLRGAHRDTSRYPGRPVRACFELKQC